MSLFDKQHMAANLKDFAHFKCEVLDNVDGNIHADLDGISLVDPE